MIRRLTIDWPDPKAFEGRDGRPIRLLAVSDDVDPAMEFEVNREAIGPLDAIVGAGDLEPDYLSFLADAFGVPLVFVRGNHDRGGRWSESSVGAPEALPTGHLRDLVGLTIAALEWPGLRRREAQRNDALAWADALRLAAAMTVRRLTGRGRPALVLSHAPPRGLGDAAADRYHVGFGAYRWLLERWRPPLWIHGHTPPASVQDWRISHDRTVLANVTGVVVVELTCSERRPGDRRPLGRGEREAA
ncbi:MAG: metallophosphoesterase [Chloroflexota bacterium]